MRSGIDLTHRLHYVVRTEMIKFADENYQLPLDFLQILVLFVVRQVVDIPLCD